MKKLFLLLLICFIGKIAFADHLKGGFFTYKYLGRNTTDSSKLRYHVTLTVYMVCDPNSSQLNTPVYFTFFDVDKKQIVQNINVAITKTYRLNRTEVDPCITGDQSVCYYIVVYDLPTVELPSNQNGYTIAYQRCCRIINIRNIPDQSSDYGNTYAITIPGASAAEKGQENNSAEYEVNDVSVVCGGNYFQIPFNATDPDGDVLTYSFCSAWAGGSRANSNPTQASAPFAYSPPDYPAIPYNSGFSGSTPLGDKVTIDSKTGIISGIAPPMPGEYVVTVCVNEYRRGVWIASNRKELHIKVGDCNAIQATLDPQYISCDGFTLSFSNQTNEGVTSYSWDFGSPGTPGNISTSPTPTFTFPDTGIYKITLLVNQGQTCQGSTTAIAKVYPGFFPGFTVNGICANKPTQFFDTTKTVYGVVDTWNWDLGEASSSADISTVQNPVYTYPQTGIKNVRFIVTNSKGCIDTVYKDLSILDKPPLSVRFKDTLICNGDRLQLHAIGNGSFSWTPLTNIINSSTADPTVFPSTTTRYSVELNDNGCINQDTVRVRVVDFVTLKAMNDTTICLTDSVQLSATGDGLKYIWSPASTIGNPNLVNPRARPTTSTTYQVISFIGSCSATDDVRITTVPYPGANAGADTSVCYRTSAQLRASIAGTSFTWSPVSSLSNANSLDPVASPPNTTAYVLTVFDAVSGCPKPKRDTVIVTIRPKVNAFAGNDTAVVVGQPLQFNATGGSYYLWSPTTSLNKGDIYNPIGFYNGSFDSIRYKLLVADESGCTDSSFITVKVFKTSPQIFVPSAFTPNRDGRNDIFRPIAVGISNIEYFRVFNRWGEMVFSTTINGKGWDGKINGKEQATGTFVWLVKGVDYTGKSVFAKGTVTLIR